jgi:lipopolysaccharide transport system ATP-binding protein
MSQPIIAVENLSKRYRLGQIGATTLRDSVQRLVHRLRRRVKPQLLVNGSQLLGATNNNRQSTTDNQDPANLWALKDVSFEVQPGEVLGIIGRNGAGKSTLLKILSRITEPTSGRAVIRGRVASLLEVGTGFHPELTGRENIFLNGAILGMRHAEIARKLDEIVDFAEVEKFIDTPVKRYSSGMYVRLAFAVAAHLEPEILLVDEVLAVGDAGFQKKCLGKMGDVARQGRTVLFVSHQMNQIRRLCHKAVWIDKGMVRMFADVRDTVAMYESGPASFRPDVARAISADQNITHFLGWALTSPSSSRPHSLETVGEFVIQFTICVSKPVCGGHHGIALYNADRLLLWADAATGFDLDPGLHHLIRRFSSLPLRPGVYSWRVSLYDENGLLDDWECVPDMIISTVPQTHPTDKWTGLLNLSSQLEIRGVISAE